MKFKQSLNKKAKFLLFSILLVLAAVFCLINLNVKIGSVNAAYSGFETIENAFSNSKFDSNTSSTYPFNPSGYDASSQPKDDEGDNINGVINLKDKEFKDLYKNFDPAEDKQFVLMIKSAAEYTTSSAYTLSASSHYEISVMVYTDKDDAVASVFLYDANAKENSSKILCSINDISSYKNWQEYKFYVSTSEFSSLSIKLGLAGNGRSVALFDNLTVKKLSESSLNNLKNENYVNKRLEDEKYLVNKENNVLSANNRLLTLFGNGVAKYSYYLTPQEDKELTDGKNTTALVIEHSEKQFSNFKTDEDYLKFEQNNLYKISIIAKALNLDGSANFKLVETGFIDGEAKTQTVSLSTSAGENSMNGYSKYNFFVKAPSDKDVQFKLELAFGSEDAGASGKIYVSSINVYKVDYKTFNEGSNKIEYTATDGENMLTNGEFNSLQVEDALKPYPATATSWTVKTGDSTSKQVYGIVNTSNAHFQKMISDNGLSSLTRPDASNNNVLMMYNANSNSLTYISPTKSLTAGAEYNGFYFNIYPVTPVNVSLVYKNNDDYVTLGSKTYNPNGKWIDGGIFLTTPYQNLEVALQFTLETEGWGACFVDNVKFDNTATQETFNKNNGIDLSNLLAVDNLNEYDFSKSAFFVGNGELVGNNAGVVNLDNPNLTSIVPIYDEQELQMLKSFDGENKNVLTISANEKTFYTFNSKIGFSLTANSYYKFSVDVFTRNITEGKGAYIALSAFEDAFKEIKTNGWARYTFYIKPDTSADKTTISLGLGNADEACAGTVFFGNIQFEPLKDVINDDDFNAVAKPSATTLIVNKVKTETNDDTDNETTANNSGSNVNWWALIPSLLFGVVIIVCVVGVMLKKVKWRRPSKKVKNAYDRNKTVSVQYYTRKATTEREAKARELQKEIDALHTDRAKYEDEYKHDLTKMRELKIKRAPSSEISALDKDMKKNRKLTSAIGLNINKLESELSYVKSDAYLNALIKKLSTEKKPIETKTDATETADKTETKGAADKTETDDKKA